MRLKMSDKTVSISITTYNSEPYIGGLLDSLFQFEQDLDYHVYVIDNASIDKTVDIVKSKACPRLTLIKSDQNIGFGGGHNRVLKYIDSKYHVCINPDVFIKNNVLARMADYMDSHEEIGILTPKILFPDGQIQILPKKDPRLIYLIARRVPLRFLKKYREEYEMRSMGDDNAFDIEFCSGAFMFMRTALFKKVEGFDKRYFLYFEDADLSRKIRKFARAQYNPQFSVYHYWERAGSKKLKFLFIQIHSMLKYMKKWRKDRMPSFTSVREAE